MAADFKHPQAVLRLAGVEDKLLSVLTPSQQPKLAVLPSYKYTMHGTRFFDIVAQVIAASACGATTIPMHKKIAQVNLRRAIECIDCLREKKYRGLKHSIS